MTALTMQVEAHEPGVLAVDLTRTDGAHSMPTVWGTIPLASLLSPVSPAPTCAAVVGEPMRVGSLFAGMGGFDLAAEWMGWSTAWYSEIDPYCQRLLAHHFPHAVALGDTVRLIPADAAARGPESEVWPVAYGVSGRVAQLRANGNAIVPACAFRIFQAIQAVEDGRVR